MNARMKWHGSGAIIIYMHMHMRMFASVDVRMQINLLGRTSMSSCGL